MLTVFGWGLFDDEPDVERDREFGRGTRWVNQSLYFDHPKGSNLLNGLGRSSKNADDGILDRK
jgi:hypothetical protein